MSDSEPGGEAARRRLASGARSFPRRPSQFGAETSDAVPDGVAGEAFLAFRGTDLTSAMVSSPIDSDLAGAGESRLEPL